ncbi:hypothetical protein BGZ83_003804 [Gryganskiella cystojenkinii]|nr:hypothetical protein BGZ83_003804 [Gryganskiella cystojenkinii]
MKSKGPPILLEDIHKNVLAGDLLVLDPNLLPPHSRERAIQWADYHEECHSRLERGIKFPRSEKSFGSKPLKDLSDEQWDTYMDQRAQVGKKLTGFGTRSILLAVGNLMSESVLSNDRKRRYLTTYFKCRCTQCGEIIPVTSNQAQHDCSSQIKSISITDSCLEKQHLLYVHNIMDELDNDKKDLIRAWHNLRVEKASTIVNNSPEFKRFFAGKTTPENDEIYVEADCQSDEWLLLQAIDRYIDQKSTWNQIVHGHIQPFDTQWAAQYNAVSIKEFLSNPLLSQCPMIVTECRSGRCAALKAEFPYAPRNYSKRTKKDFKHTCLGETRDQLSDHYGKLTLTSIYELPTPLARRWWLLACQDNDRSFRQTLLGWTANPNVLSSFGFYK